MTSGPGQRSSGQPEHRPTASWVRVVLATAAVVALLLVGAAAGLLVAQSRTSSAGSAPAPDSVAVGFCQDMTVHHRQAVRMAGVVRTNSTDPAIRGMAFDIETNQLEQIGRMQGWLNLWGRDPLPIGGHMAWMSGPAATHGHSLAPGGPVTTMPGMATGEELARLETLRGPELDTLFLQLMLRHHQGGLPMMRYAADRAEAGVVRNLAAQMATSQTHEVDVITAMLAQRGATPLPPPN